MSSTNVSFDFEAIEAQINALFFGNNLKEEKKQQKTVATKNSKKQSKTVPKKNKKQQKKIEEDDIDSNIDINEIGADLSDIESYISEQEVYIMKKEVDEEPAQFNYQCEFTGYIPEPDMLKTGMDIYVSENIQKLSADFDIPVSTIQDAIECNIFVYVEMSELRQNIEAFFEQSSIRPSGLIYNYFDTEWNCCEVLHYEPQEFIEICNKQPKMDDNNDQDNFGCGIAIDQLSEDLQNIFEQKKQISCSESVECQTIETEEMNKIDKKTFCNKCKLYMQCPGCGQGQLQIQLPIQKQNTSVIQQFNDKLIDIMLHYDNVICSYQKNDGDVEQVQQDRDSIMMLNYDMVFKSDHNNFPLKQYLDYRKQSLRTYQFSNNAIGSYGNIHNKDKLTLQKIIVDNNLRFINSCEYYLVALDIETYHKFNYDEVPEFKDQDAHIGICSLSIQKYSQTGPISEVERHCFVNDKDYHIQSSVQDTIIVHTFQSEQAMSMEVFNFIAGLHQGNLPIIVITFNGSCSQFNDSCGYDIPFLYNRSCMKAALKKQVIKIGEKIVDENIEVQIKSQMITGIQGLPYVYFVDIKQRLESLIPQDTKNQMVNKKLETYLEYYNLGGKQEHNYRDLQQRLSQNKSDISDIVTYCQRDCDALLDLNNAASVIALAMNSQKVLQIPLQYALYQTNANQLSLFLMREYTQKGYAISYYGQSQSDDKFKGAYCETEESIMCKKIYNVIGPDFASLYPNSTISINGCLSTFQDQQSDNCIKVDIIDDNQNAVNSYYFSKNKGVIPELLKDMFQQRKNIKAAMKGYNRGSNEYVSLDIQQLAIKNILNTLYGLSGNQKSPLFWRPLAESITSFGRQSTLCAKRILQQKGAQFLSADTDSVFCTIPQGVDNYAQLQALMQDVNIEIQQVMNSQYLTMEIEEVYQTIHFSRSKKSYIATMIKDNDFKNWTRDMYAAKVELKIRGATWSKQEQSMRNIIRQQLFEYLTTDISAINYFDNIYNSVGQLIEKSIQQRDIKDILKYAQRVKISGSKSNEAKHLKQYYSQLCKDQDYLEVMLTIGQGSKTNRKIPVQYLQQCITSIDQVALRYNAVSMYAKLLLTKEQTSSLPTQFKMQMDELVSEIRSDQILVRITKIGTKRQPLELWNRNEIQQKIYAAKQKGVSVNEIVVQDNIRLFFDIEHCNKPQHQIQQEINEVVRKYLNFEPKSYILSSYISAEDIRYHIYYDVTINWQFAYFIGTQLSHLGVDSNVYRNKQLRLPNVCKIKDDIKKDNSYDCKYDMLHNMLITPDEKHPIINTPLHIIQKPIIDEQLTGFNQYKHNQEDIILLTRELSQRNMPFTIKEDRPGKIYLERSRASICPLCSEQHDSNNMTAYIYKSQIVLYCHSEKCQGKSINIIKQQEETKQLKITKKQCAIDQKILKIQELINSSSHHNNILQKAIIQDSNYLDLDIYKSLQDNHLICIRSQLGTGKSHQVQQFLEQCTDNILIISHRRSYTANIMQRYPGFINYQEESGNISLQEHKRVICQVESLSRIRQKQDCVLIVDEIESILSQLNSNISKKQDATQHFIDILQKSKQVIAMDGFLQQHTIEMLNIIRNQQYSTQQFSVYQNIFKPYTGNNVTIKQYKQTAQEDIFQDISSKLHQGKRIVCMITVKQLAQQIATDIKKLFGQYKVALYTGEELFEFEGQRMCDIKKEAFQNVNEAFKVDLLIYTSTITAGVDFNLEHFNTFVHVYAANTCNSQQFIQGIGRNRKWLDKDHIIYYEHRQLSEKPLSPHDLVHEKYESVCSRNQEQQLNLWIESREQSINYYRSNIVFSQLRELGFELTYDHNLQHIGKLTEDNYFITVPITQEDVDEYEKISKNKSLIPQTYLNMNQFKKIQLLKYTGLDLFEQYEEGDQNMILKATKSLKYYNWFKNLCDGNIDSVEGILDGDVQLRTLNQDKKGSKNIDIAKLKRFNDDFTLFKQIQNILVVGKQFTKNDTPVYIQSNPRIEQLLNNAAALGGYSIEKFSQKRTNQERITTYIVSKIISNE